VQKKKRKKNDFIYI